MANMSYCRFRNTLLDLEDCFNNIMYKAENIDDERARMRMLERIKDFYESGEIDEAFEAEAENEDED